MSVSKGRFYENKVKKFLQDKGFLILTSNFYTPYGEIDLIAEKENKIFFIEVKFLLKNKFINPILKVDNPKVRKIFLSISYLKKFCHIKNFQVDSYSLYYKEGRLNFEHYSDLRLQ
jgi:putative endonuclease